MLGDITTADEIYIVCGYTDYPRRIIREVLCLRVESRTTKRPENPRKNDYSGVIIGQWLEKGMTIKPVKEICFLIDRNAICFDMLIK